MNIVLDVHGMSCGHCVKSITAAVTPLAGVTSVDVDLAAKKVTVTGNADPGVVPASEVAPPPDLARMAPSVTRTRDGRLLQSVVDVRGMSIAVSVTGSQKPADSATFWQLLRTQITKVEKAR